MYERRLKVFLVIVAVAVAVLLGRLAYMQLLRSGEYRRRAEKLLTTFELLPTVRGRILDRKGRVLALDRACYDLCLDYRMLTEDMPQSRRWVARRVRGIRKELGVTASQAEGVYARRVERTWELAGRLTGTPRNEMARAAQRALRRVRAIRRVVGTPIKEETQPHPVVTGLDESAAVAVRTHLKEMIGASVRPAHQRWYPYGAEACHVIGLVGQVNAAEQDAQLQNCSSTLQVRLTRYLDGDLIGKGGAEKASEGLLRGRRGYRRQRRTGEVIEHVPARFGSHVHLTLDMDLQRDVAALLARAGAAVVLDVATGEVLAMVSLPVYDLNSYRKNFRALGSDRANLPLWNRALAVRYPPGSTFKPLAALAGLASGRVDAHTAFHCPGYLISPTYPALRCWKRSGHGSLDLVAGLEHSCNVFFYKLGRRVGLRKQVEWLGKMGFADVPGTGLGEERPSKLPDPRAARGAAAEMLAIGQGVTTTCMHVASAMATIARGGELRSPLLIRKATDGQGRTVEDFAARQQVRRLPITPAQMELVKRGMYKVVNSTSGTAYEHFRGMPIEICGKTGTAQTPPRRIDSNGDGRIDARDRIVRSGDTAWFAGFAPYRNPRIAFAVVVEYSQTSGGRTCGPIARGIVRLCQGLGYL